MRGHTGGFMSIGQVIIHSKSSNQKINTKSSPETELLGVNDYIPWTLWEKICLLDQGYKIIKNSFIKITKVL